MKIKVIKDGYYVTEDLTGIGMVNKDTFESSFSHLLVVGDVWELRTDRTDNDYEYEFFECIEGDWLGWESDEWWEYKDYEGYFKVID